MAHDWLLRRRKRKSPLPSPKKKLKRFKLSELRKEAEKSSAVSSATEIDLEAKLKKSVADVSADEEKSACSVQKELQSSNTNEKKSEPESGYKRILRSSHRTKADDSSDVQVIDSSSKQSYESVLNNKPILTAEKRKGDETELAVKYKNENKQIRHERENEDVAAPEVQSQKLSSQTTTTSSSVSSDDEPLVIDLSDNDDNDGDNDKSKKQLAAGKETVSIESKTSEQSSEKNKVQKRQYPGNNNHITSQKHDVEVPLTKVDLLSKAAETARKVFGPCSVQRVHLKNGKTVYAYAPHEVPKLTSNKNSTVTSSHTMPIGLSHSGNNVRNLNDVFHAIDSISKGVACAQTSSVSSVPEEIILDDSDDEVQEITDANSCRTLNVHNSAMESSEHKDTNIELQEHSKISNSNVNL
ncbi:uncharacterized protein DDB_G0283697-like isoform X2 [Stegodyphus dumicola]|uniref:uncharacterized protein DDB_G0283697-like isoform X2 n=1 Tax=Stegodyphus dumicola TaxID=202533 RepID=UPI0015B32966|nr:uncharacterized protein DDB_G0283697-like isoform X2 [Stegodyphus dumicola]